MNILPSRKKLVIVAIEVIQYVQVKHMTVSLQHTETTYLYVYKCVVDNSAFNVYKLTVYKTDCRNKILITFIEGYV